MSPEELANIAARAKESEEEIGRRVPQRRDWLVSVARIVAVDVPALLAEVLRLNEILKSNERVDRREN